MGNPLAKRKVAWCNRSIVWTALAGPGEGDPRLRSAVWCYHLDGLTYFGFPFDPGESETTTTQRALNWLNRYHLIVRREHLADDEPAAVRSGR